MSAIVPAESVAGVTFAPTLRRSKYRDLLTELKARPDGVLVLPDSESARQSLARHAKALGIRLEYGVRGTDICVRIAAGKSKPTAKLTWSQPHSTACISDAMRHHGPCNLPELVRLTGMHETDVRAALTDMLARGSAEAEAGNGRWFYRLK